VTREKAASLDSLPKTGQSYHRALAYPRWRTVRMAGAVQTPMVETTRLGSFFRKGAKGLGRRTAAQGVRNVDARAGLSFTMAQGIAAQGARLRGARRARLMF
jgi:hypothetical protein